MTEKRKRCQYFSSDEKEKLLKSLLEHKLTILNQGIDDTIDDDKSLAWIQLTRSFNATGRIYRSKETLMELWEKMKSECKMYFSDYRSKALQSGSGPTVIKVDPILELVCSILGQEYTDVDDVKDCYSQYIEEDSFPKVICMEMEETKTTPVEIDIDSGHPIMNYAETNATPKVIIKSFNDDIIKNESSLSSSRHANERSQSMGDLCSSFMNMNRKKEDVEDLKCMALEGKIGINKKIYQFKLDAANLDVKIKKQVLERIKDD